MDGLVNMPDDGIRRALDVAGVALVTIDSEGHALSANTAFAELFGTEVAAVIGRHLVGLCHSTHSAALTAALVRILGAVSESELLTVEPAGSTTGDMVRLSLTSSAARRSGERVIFGIASAVGSDGTRLVPTGPPPREQTATRATTLTQQLERAAATAARTGQPYALLRCDFGVGGDNGTDTVEMANTELLRIAVARISQRLRSDDSVVVDNGHMIHVIAEALGDVQDAAGVAYRMLSTMVEPFALEGARRFAHLTIGIALGDGSTSPTLVIDAAEEALREARGHGRGSFRIADLCSPAQEGWNPPPISGVP